MKSKEEILAKRIIRFPAGDRRLAAGAMTDEAIKRNVYAAMEEYATQFKDSPYQGSAGTWVKASERLPDTFWVGPVRFDHRKAHWTYGVRSGDQMVYAANLYEDLEWLDSAVSPAGDGWVSEKPDLQRECLFNTASWFKDHWEYGLWEIKKVDNGDGWYYGLCNNEGEEWGPIEDLKADKYLILPTPPTKSV